MVELPEHFIDEKGNPVGERLNDIWLHSLAIHLLNAQALYKQALADGIHPDQAKLFLGSGADELQFVSVPD